ncbi:Phasin protein [Tranquillimonas rosea]|uniref:Phasin protein n=1 Tax=Tranquillimonas rosea TaxID=641238 RepID=A0A1H9STF1_9RHOB|nr:phasin family protein [Tranquillimonas rosea]SER88147.1 Phasin protein [Tranquillimonas rosea]
MAKQNTKSAATDLQNLFDPQGYQDIFQSWAQTGERMMGIATEAATRSTDIASESAKETFSNLREVSQVRDEPADYGKAYSDFAQKQMNLFMRTAQSMSEIGQKTSAEATGLASQAGEDLGNKVAANTQSAANTAAKKAS